MEGGWTAPRCSQSRAMHNGLRSGCILSQLLRCIGMPVCKCAKTYRGEQIRGYGAHDGIGLSVVTAGENHLMAMCRQPPDNVPPQEAGAAGDQDFHHDINKS